MARPIFLVGMMASGKTTVGRRLAAATGAVFCDLDRRIERITGRTVEQWFARGEAEFRAAEAGALRSLIAEPGFAAAAVVVATGGGAVIEARNRAAMRSVGAVVLLDVPLAELARRVAADPVGRPLLAGAAVESDLARLWHARAQAYRDGALVVPADDEPDAVVARIVRGLAEAAAP